MGLPEKVDREGRELDLSTYDRNKFNILSPILRMDTAAPYLRMRAVEVRVDPDVEKGEVYAAPGTRWERKQGTGEYLPTHVSLAKPGLLKVASAAGLVLDPRHSGPVGHAHDEGPGATGSPELRRHRSWRHPAQPGARCVRRAAEGARAGK